MALYKILSGNKFVVADTERPGHTKELCAGELIELTDDEASDYAGKIEPFVIDHNAPAADPIEVTTVIVADPAAQ